MYDIYIFDSLPSYNFISIKREKKIRNHFNVTFAARSLNSAALASPIESTNVDK